MILMAAFCCEPPQLLPATSNHRRLRQTSPSRCWTSECGDVKGQACGAVGLLLDDLAIINGNHANGRNQGRDLRESPCKASPLAQGIHPRPPRGKGASSKHGSQPDTHFWLNRQHRPTAKPMVSTGKWRQFDQADQHRPIGQADQEQRKRHE